MGSVMLAAIQLPERGPTDVDYAQHVNKQEGQMALNQSPEFCLKLTYLGMFKNNEAFHFMASHAHVCLDFKDQT